MFMSMYVFLYKTDILVTSISTHGNSFNAVLKAQKTQRQKLKTFDRTSLQIWNLDKEPTNITPIVPFVLFHSCDDLLF